MLGPEGGSQNGREGMDLQCSCNPCGCSSVANGEREKVEIKQVLQDGFLV